MRRFSHTSTSVYRRCRAQYKWKYIDNLAPAEGVGRVRGSAGHAALAEWYRNGCDEEADGKAMKVMADHFNAAEASSGRDLSQEWELMKIIAPRYFDWARANDDFEEILAIEQEFEIRIGDHVVMGFIDGVVRSENGSIWLLEHKFNKQVSTKHIDLDSQMSMYLLAARILGINATGILYNVIRVAEGGIAKTQPVERRMVYRRADGLAVIEKELIVQLDEMVRFHENGGNPVFRNPTANCSWDCSFYNTCLAINDSGNPVEELGRLPKSERGIEKDLGEPNE